MAPTYDGPSLGYSPEELPDSPPTERWKVAPRNRKRGRWWSNLPVTQDGNREESRRVSGKG